MSKSASKPKSTSARAICVIGDVHGHLSLALCLAARWQQELGLNFEAVCLCGDVGTFTQDSQLDNATRRHAKSNICELEFLNVWSRNPFPKWVSRIFEPIPQHGLGLDCPIVMVHGNHEGFEHLEQLLPAHYSKAPVSVSTLPTVDAGGRIHYLPSGWQCRTRAGTTIAGIGGIESGQRAAKYHPLAYLELPAIKRLPRMDRSDLLITHQGPARTQADGGSELLDVLLDGHVSRVWCHGHCVRNPDIVYHGLTTVVPLHDIAFHSVKDKPLNPANDAMAVIEFHENDEIRIQRGQPLCWRDYRKHRWTEVGEVLVPPGFS